MRRSRETAGNGGSLRGGLAVGFVLLATMYVAVTGWRALAALLRPAVAVPSGGAAGVVVALSAATLLGAVIRLLGAAAVRGTREVDGAVRDGTAPWLSAALAGGLITAVVTVGGAVDRAGGSVWEAVAVIADSPSTLLVNVTVGVAIVLVAAPAVIAGHAAADRWLASRH